MQRVSKRMAKIEQDLVEECASSTDFMKKFEKWKKEDFGKV